MMLIAKLRSSKPTPTPTEQAATHIQFVKACSDGDLALVQQIHQTKSPTLNFPQADVICPALSEAAFMGRLEVVRFLLEKAGAKVNVKKPLARKSHHPIINAARGGHAAVLDYLLKKCKLNAAKITTDLGENLLHLVVESGNAVLGKALMDQGVNFAQRAVDIVVAEEKNGPLPLHIALRAGQLAFCQMLLQADPAAIEQKCFLGTSHELAIESDNLAVVTLSPQARQDRALSCVDGVRVANLNFASLSTLKIAFAKGSTQVAEAYGAESLDEKGAAQMFQQIFFIDEERRRRLLEAKNGNESAIVAAELATNRKVTNAINSRWLVTCKLIDEIDLKRLKTLLFLLQRPHPHRLWILKQKIAVTSELTAERVEGWIIDWVYDQAGKVWREQPSLPKRKDKERFAVHIIQYLLQQNAVNLVDAFRMDSSLVQHLLFHSKNVDEFFQLPAPTVTDPDNFEKTREDYLDIFIMYGLDRTKRLPAFWPQEFCNLNLQHEALREFFTMPASLTYESLSPTQIQERYLLLELPHIIAAVTKYIHGQDKGELAALAIDLEKKELKSTLTNCCHFQAQQFPEQIRQASPLLELIIANAIEVYDVAGIVLHYVVNVSDIAKLNIQFLSQNSAAVAAAGLLGVGPVQLYDWRKLVLETTTVDESAMVAAPSFLGKKFCFFECEYECCISLGVLAGGWFFFLWIDDVEYFGK